jgi:hypothetical protein
VRPQRPTRNETLFQDSWQKLSKPIILSCLSPAKRLSGSR